MTMTSNKIDIYGEQKSLVLARFRSMNPELKIIIGVEKELTIKDLISHVEKGDAYSRVIGYELVPASIKRNVRRGRNRIDISFPISSKSFIRFFASLLLGLFCR